MFLKQPLASLDRIGCYFVGCGLSSSQLSNVWLPISPRVPSCCLKPTPSRPPHATTASVGSCAPRPATNSPLSPSSTRGQRTEPARGADSHGQVNKADTEEQAEKSTTPYSNFPLFAYADGRRSKRSSDDLSRSPGSVDRDDEKLLTVSMESMMLQLMLQPFHAGTFKRKPALEMCYTRY